MRFEEAARRKSFAVAGDLPQDGQCAIWPYVGRMKGPKLWPRLVPSGAREQVTCTDVGGQGRDRTADLPLFRRTLIPTELPGRKAVSASPYWRP